MLREKLLMSLPSHYLVRTGLLLFPGIIVSVTVQLALRPYLPTEILQRLPGAIAIGCNVGFTTWINNKYELALKEIEKAETLDVNQESTN